MDRTGIAALGAIALVAGGSMTAAEAWAAVDVPTIALLFGLMVVSAQLRLGDSTPFSRVRPPWPRSRPPMLLGVVMGAAALLSAFLANDIVCLAMAPVLLESCARRSLHPAPYLIGLACAANIGSAATLIGNPQNMLIGQVTGLSFKGYLLLALPPTVLGLLAAWGVIVFLYRSRWRAETRLLSPDVSPPALDLWQSGKGCALLAGLVAVFLFGPWPREAPALGCAGLLLLNRRLASRRMLSLVDWQLILLFIGLFVVKPGHGSPRGCWRGSTAGWPGAGVNLDRPGWLFAVTVVLSNLVSNVPAVMLLLPMNSSPQSGAVLALASSLAGNLFLLGSIANLIVADQASRLGFRLTWLAHARVGVPVTLITALIAYGWLWLAEVGG